MWIGKTDSDKQTINIEKKSLEELVESVLEYH